MIELWNAIVEFNNEYFPNWRRTPEIFLSNALAGEAGELCNVIKHRAGGGTNRRYEPRSRIAEELVDVLIYLVLMAETHEYDFNEFEKAVRAKLEENAKRLEEPEKISGATRNP